MTNILSASFRLATPEDGHLLTYDNTKLEAYGVCPTYGIITYQMHRRMHAGGGRALALEAGSAMHEVFAYIRLCTLHEHKHVDAFLYHGQRLFGKARWGEILSHAPPPRAGAINAKAGAIAVLETGQYYDDPMDRRRTLSNMEECALAYIDRWDWRWPVWMRDDRDPTSDVGIEIPFDLVVSVVRNDETGEEIDRRYTGKIDGIRVIDGRITLEENKTASRLNDAWSMSFALRTQITGYCIAASVFTNETIRDADVHGISIPLPRGFDYGGIVRERVTRKDYHITKWIEWLDWTAGEYERQMDNPYDALRYTHSCSRYFRPCSLIAFCDNERDEQEQMISEMEEHEWSPLHGVSADE